MRDLIQKYLEVAFVFSVTGAAMVHPALALITGAGFFVALAVVTDRRTPAPEAEK